MTRLIANLLVLVAVLLMPFGMQAAAAAPAVQHHSASSMPMSHCPDGQGQTGSNAGIAECTMICASALPAAGNPQVTRLLIVCEVPRTVGAQPLTGIQPDIATPPPKAS